MRRERCGRGDAPSLIMSMFDTAMICPDCKDAERAHPDYRKAADAERAALLSGDRNFPGIGRPADL